MTIASLELLKPSAKIVEFWKKLRDRKEKEIDDCYREQLDEIMLEMHAEWRAFMSEERPTTEDFLLITSECDEAYAKAGSYQKRKLLREAYFSYFNPKFYNEGVSRELWNLVQELDYPHVRLLRKICENTLSENRWENGEDLNGGPYHLTYEDADFMFLQRLVDKGLVMSKKHQVPNNEHTTVLPVAGPCRLLIDFLRGPDQDRAPADGSDQ